MSKTKIGDAKENWDHYHRANQNCCNLKIDPPLRRPHPRLPPTVPRTVAPLKAITHTIHLSFANRLEWLDVPTSVTKKARKARNQVIARKPQWQNCQPYVDHQGQ